MKKYLYLQFKRMLKLFPFIIVSTIVLFAVLMIVFSGIMKHQNENEDMKKFKVGIVGDTDNSYLELGLSFINTIDESRFSMELEILDEETARQLLKEKRLSAYIVLPEGFMTAALQGEVRTIKFITNADSTGLILALKDEVTGFVEQILTQTQKGVYGVQKALDSNGYPELSYEYLNRINVEYMDLIFHRSDIYEIEELGISDGLMLPEYLFCGITVLFFMLAGLPYAIILIRKDIEFNRILAARRFAAAKQIICEYAAYTGIMLAVSFVVIAILLNVPKAVGYPELLDSSSIGAVTVNIAASVIMITAFNIMLFEISENIINGIFMHLFFTIALCYVTGCFYPVYFFPKIIQKISVFLPTGIVRRCFADYMENRIVIVHIAGILVFAALFFLITVLVRRCRILKKEV